MRRVASALVLLVAAGCGGSPTGPETSVPVSLQPGRYLLRIFTQTPVAPGGTTPTTFVCLTIGARPSRDAVAVSVDVSRDGDRWVVRGAAGALRMQLEERPGSLHGSLEGQASEGPVTVTIGNSPQHQSPASVVGSANASSFSGEIAGDVTFSEAGGSYSCSSNGWTLVRQ